MGKTNEKSSLSALNTFKCVFAFVLIMNIMVLLERTVFDFLGFMFGAIIADVFHLVFLIIGLFGSYQYRVNYLVVTDIDGKLVQDQCHVCLLMSIFCLIAKALIDFLLLCVRLKCIAWCLLWIGWNIFIICNYLNIGPLNRYDPYVLSLNANKKSWWLMNGIGCTTNVNDLVLSQRFDGISEKKETYDSLDMFLNKNCILPFYWIEIIHSSVFIFFTTLNIIFGLLLSNVFNDEDDTFDYIGGFETSNIVYAYNTDHVLSNNAHVRLEPLYVYVTNPSVCLHPITVIYIIKVYYFLVQRTN